MFQNLFQNVPVNQIITLTMAVVFFLALVGYVVLGAVLNFHWRQYAHNPLATLIFNLFYFVLGGALLAAMVLAQFSYV